MKNSYNKVLKSCNNVEILFTDLFGKSREVIIPKHKLKHALKYGLKCDGSSVSNQKDVCNSDLKIFLDINSFYKLPNKNMLIFAQTSDEYDSRKNLQNFEKKLKKSHFFANFGAEIEFFLFDYQNFNKNRKINTLNFCQKSLEKYNDKLNYFEISNDRSYNTLNEILEFCKDSNIEIEQCHHECANNQYEIDFKYDLPTKTADNIVYIKKIITYFAEKNGFYACFLPKPIPNQSGSGMHVNISITNKFKKNLFYKSNGKFGLSRFALNFSNNIVKHIGAITAIANPQNNSFERLNAKVETPTKICINKCDRSALIRVPNTTKKNTRIELRSPDVSCNPYLTFLAILKAGFDDKKENLKKRILQKKLPNNLIQALDFLKSDKCLSQLVPKNYYEILKNKK